MSSRIILIGCVLGLLLLAGAFLLRARTTRVLPPRLGNAVAARNTMAVADTSTPVDASRSMKEEMLLFLDGIRDGVDLATLDRMSERFLSDAKTMRAEKIALLIEFLRRNSATYALGNKYACDLLAFLKPHEAHAELAEIFNSTVDRTVRLELLGVMEAAATLDSVDQAQEALEAFVADAKRIKDFLQTGIDQPDPLVADRSLKAYCAAAAPDEAVAAIESAALTWLKKASEGRLTQDDTTPAHLLQLVVECGIATPEAQDELIPLLPKLLEAFPRDRRGTFDNYLFEVSANANLTDSSRAALLKIVTENQPPPSAESDYFRWLLAVGALSTSSQDDRPVAMMNLLRAENDALRVASALVFSPDQFFQQIPQVDRNRYLQLLSNAFPPAVEEAQKLIEAATERLTNG